MAVPPQYFVLAVVGLDPSAPSGAHSSHVRGCLLAFTVVKSLLRRRRLALLAERWLRYPGRHCLQDSL